MLDSAKITATAEKLAARVGERFPDSSLRKIADELVQLSRDSGSHAASLVNPIIWLRILIAVVIVVAAVIFVLVGTFFSFDRLPSGAFDFVQGLEAAINTIIFAGVGLYTLITLEERIKRKQALDGLHALRSVIHIIDMHQLTKDPVAVGAGVEPTETSPKRTLTPAELQRYLDYCSEMLSITGKLAALYAQSLDDALVVEAVNDIETLGTNLSRKIWQKIMLIERDAPVL